ncbi:MAG: hypothetical protein KC503_18125 [Myxococcales bacterium]|nr:hypothetical protein [Myxococcales bacterium]
MSRTRWSGAAPLDAAHVAFAPARPGVIMLMRGRAIDDDNVLWVEAVNNVRSRLADLAEASEEEAVSPVHYCVVTEDDSLRRHRLAEEIRISSFRRRASRCLVRRMTSLPARR